MYDIALWLKYRYTVPNLFLIKKMYYLIYYDLKI